MDSKTAKGVTTTDLTTLKKLWDKEEKDNAQKKEEQKKKLPKGVGIANKRKALNILKNAGFESKAQESNLPTLNADIVKQLTAVEATIKAFYQALETVPDELAAREWQREIEEFLTKIQDWKSNFPSRVKSLLVAQQPAPVVPSPTK